MAGKSPATKKGCKNQYFDRTADQFYPKFLIDGNKPSIRERYCSSS